MRRALVIAAAVSLALPSSASAQEPVSCATLAGGTTGLPEFVAGPLLDLARRTGSHQLIGAPAPAGLNLPDRVALRSTQETFNSGWAFVLRGGHVYFRPAEGGDVWRRMPLPSCFDGRVTAISADGPYLVAVDRARRLYSMDNANRDPLSWSWTSRWGPPFWVNPAGQVLPEDTAAWELSVLSSVEDVSWTDPADHKQTVGGGNVTTIYALRGDRRRIALIDPWLPNDYSYEVCGPQGGRLQIASLAASGSTLFVTDRFGDLYTRLWDFDISGADNVFFRYSFEDQRGKPVPPIPLPNYVPTGTALDVPPIQLPAPPWVRQPKVPGRISDAIAISKSGAGSAARVLRVAGWDAAGRVGYWEKPIAASGWRFVEGRRTSPGAELKNPAKDRSAAALEAADDDIWLRDDGGGFSAVVPQFSSACSPSTLRVRPRDGGQPVNLVLHTIDALRQEPRGEGLDGTPRAQLATVEVPPSVSAADRARLPSGLGSRRFTSFDLSATAKSFTLPGLGSFTRTPAFTVRSVRAGRRGRLTVRIAAATDGKLRVTPRINRRIYADKSRRLARAGAMTLRLSPRRWAKRRLERGRRAQLAVRVSFTPEGGVRLSRTFKRTVRPR